MHIKNLTFNMVPNALRHPSESGHYLVAYLDMRHNEVSRVATLEYSKKFDAWNASDEHADYAIDHDHILAWTPFKPIVDNLQGMVKEADHEQ